MRFGNPGFTPAFWKRIAKPRPKTKETWETLYNYLRTMDKLELLKAEKRMTKTHKKGSVSIQEVAMEAMGEATAPSPGARQAPPEMPPMEPRGDERTGAYLPELGRQITIMGHSITTGKDR